MADGGAERENATSFSSLPPALQHAIFVRVPVDARARAKLVSRGWNCSLSDVSLWTRLDLSPASGVRVRVTDDVLRRASGLARGALVALDVSYCDPDVTHDMLLAVMAANVGLTELRCNRALYHELSDTAIQALLHAAPRLTALDAHVSCNANEQLLSMLRNEPPFGPLRVHHLNVSYNALAPAEREAAVTALAADIAAHDSLSSLALRFAALAAPVVLDVVVDAVLLRRVHFLELLSCRLSPASAPSLARLLLGGSALTQLRIWISDQLLNAPAAALLAGALRANSTLTTLILGGVVSTSGTMRLLQPRCWMR
jgi:hypothetical protein